ncbi:MAG TPA: phosphoribosylanthranilate isomerase [Candidatus Acidoferrum sp.]|nr:phosphoribosylanthranilate isomerase [Candidatus Acidoferrum sp.]
MSKVQVKICGITNAADALASVEAGANLLGFNFYPQSPREISEAAAAKIRAQLPKRVKVVGIFVNRLPADVITLRQSVALDFVQLHGDEPPEAVAELARSAHVIKAFRLETDFPLATLDEYPGVFAYLFDGANRGQYGGTGRTTDWDVARRAAQSHRIILAGGLKVENVAAAVRIVRPYGIDVASGVEAEPGKKDHGLLREFIQEVRRAEKK